MCYNCIIFREKGGISISRAIKKRTGLQAWQLGQGSAMEKRLIASGKIVLHENGQYELFSQETKEKGEIANAGDYFKVDSHGFPYPNTREMFEQGHRLIQDDWYEQLAQPVRVHLESDPSCEELEYLLSTSKLRVHPEDPEHYYSASLWGTEETAPRSSVIVFYSVDRNAEGEITHIDFNFVEREEFRRTYTILSGENHDESSIGPL